TGSTRMAFCSSCIRLASGGKLGRAAMAYTNSMAKMPKQSSANQKYKRPARCRFPLMSIKRLQVPILGRTLARSPSYVLYRREGKGFPRLRPRARERDRHMAGGMRTSPGRRLREAWQAGTIAVPGVFNALVARMAERLGFPAVYLSGAALSASAAVPD